MKFLIFLLPFALIAKPSGMQTISGKATCKEEAGTLVIESGKRAIVKWNEFSIGKGERVHFLMPDSKSAVLNRVSGGQSRLLGQLDSNGKVYLLNPKGVLIGKDAIINTASFVASSLDVLDQDFLRGEELLFSGDSDADIVNLGTISCLQGDVALIAHNVANRGKIEGDFVGLAIGPEILLKPQGNQRIFVKANGGDSIQHSGEIHALAAELRSASVYDHAICCSGSFEATKTEKKSGRVYLVAEKGKTNLDGVIIARGGEVQVLGNKIFLGDHAEIDVSAKGGGGKVFVGGDYQGLNSEIYNAQDVVVSNGATVKADAEEFGDGGKIIFWADRCMQHHGEIFARGGEEAGDGGFVEVSGFKLLDFQGRCNCRAPVGKVGMLLLDPDSDITISAAATSGVSSSPTPLTYFPTVTTGANLLNTTLQTALNSSDVTVTTSGSATSLSADLTVSAGISWSEGNTLTLIARDKVIIEGAISCTTSDGDGILNATGSSVEVNGSSGGSISVETINLTATAGQVLMETTTITGPGGSSDNVTLDATQTTAGLDAVSISASTLNADVLDVSGIVSGGGSSGKGIAIASSSTLNIDTKIDLVGTGQDDDGINISDSTISLGGNDTFIVNGSAVGATSGGLIGVNINTGSALDSLSVGNMEITGSVTGAAIPGTTGNIGVRIDASTLDANSGNDSAGSMIVTGSAGAGSDDNYGVQISSVSTVESISGDIVIIGNPTTAPTSTGMDNYGVFITDSGTTISSTAGAAINITGLGGDGTTENHGINIDSGVTISGVVGDITLSGTGGAGTSTNNHGVLITGGASTASISSSGAGAISVTGIGGGTGGGTGTNRGIIMNGAGTADSAAVTSTSSSISITGTKGASTNVAISLNNGALVESTSSGDVTISTTGDLIVDTSDVEAAGLLTINATSSLGPNDAITFDTATITGNGGPMITGTKTGGTGSGLSATTSALIFGAPGTIEGTGIDDDGISFVSSSFTSNAGSVNLTGVVNSSTIGNVSGVYFDSTSSILGSGSMIVSGSFASSVVGVSDLKGVFLDGATVTNSGSGTFSFSGTGGASGTSGCNGIQFSSATVTSTTGNLTFNGIAGNSTSANSNDGVELNGGSITTTSGNVTLNGNQSFQPSSAGGQCIGVFIGGNASITSLGSGRIRINGRGGAGTTSNFGVQVNTASITSNPAATGSIRIHGVGGNGTDDNFAVFLDTDSVITSTSGNIVVNGNQTTTLPSGSGGNFMGVKLNNGAIVSSLGNAGITMKGTGGNGTGDASIGVFFQNSFVSAASSGNVTLTGIGGLGTSSLQGVRIENSPVTLASGNLTINGTGGEGSSTDNHGIVVRSASVVSTTSGAINFVGRAATNSSTNEGVRIFNAGSSVTTATGSISCTGFASGTSTTGVHVTDSGVVSSTGTAPITLQTFSDIVIDEGGTVTGGSGLLEVISDRDLIIRGGTTDTTPSGIFLGSGNGRFIVARNLSVFGGSGDGSFAQIGALTDSSANLDFIRIGNRLLVDGISTNSYALIGHGDPTVGGAVFSGNILFREIRGETIVRGATTAGVGTDGFAQIGHIDGAGATLSGDVKFLTKGSLFVLGGLATTDAYARIGHGGQSGGGTFGASVMDLLIGRSIQLTSTTAEAQIVNPSPSSPLILVVDNLHPKPPEFGLATFTQEGSLTANGELRIYTVDRALNTITNMINGEVFAPPALQIDNPQEEFSIYFPNGTFSTASFRIYYKTPIAAKFPHLGMYRLGLANAQLQDELPIFRYMRLPNYPQYHANFCGETAEGIDCLNNLDPYGSFIFEDNVYWVGGR